MHVNFFPEYNIGLKFLWYEGGKGIIVYNTCNSIYEFRIFQWKCESSSYRFKNLLLFFYINNCLYLRITNHYTPQKLVHLNSFSNIIFIIFQLYSFAKSFSFTDRLVFEYFSQITCYFNLLTALKTLKSEIVFFFFQIVTGYSKFLFSCT